MNARIVDIIKRVYGPEYTEELGIGAYKALWPLISLDLEDCKYEYIILLHKECTKER